jgi:phosphoglycolate phosphatase
MIHTVILDFDGTLASTLPGIDACMAEMFEAFGHSRPSLAQVRATVGLPLESAVRLLAGPGCDNGKIQDMVCTYRALHHQKAAALSSLFEGALETLLDLRSRGIESILVSNRGKRGLHQMTEHLGIKECLSAMLGADEVPYRKPDSRLFTHSIVPILANPDREGILVVGDTEWDLLFARNAGLKSCWASYGYGDPDKCLALEPDFTIPAITGLCKLLGNWNLGQ